VAVHPLGGGNSKASLDAARPSVGAAKAKIDRVQGAAAEEPRQELHRVVVRVARRGGGGGGAGGRCGGRTGG
jgi:hypothetical protein